MKKRDVKFLWLGAVCGFIAGCYTFKRTVQMGLHLNLSIQIKKKGNENETENENV